MAKTPGREDRERTAEDKQATLEAGAELEAKIRVFQNKTNPLAISEDLQVEDPFSGLYENDFRRAKDDEARQGILKSLGDAHFLDHWFELRKAEAERIAVLREEAERNLVSKREGGASEKVLRIAESTVRELQKREDAAVSHALEVEDDRAGVVETVSRNLIIEPPHHPGVLENLVTSNSSLGQLVNAMEVNIDGTGWELVPTDTLKFEEEIEREMPGATPEDAAVAEAKQFEQNQARLLAEKEFQDEVDSQLESLEGFFKEPWPGMSFTTLRRKLRVDAESTGNAYLEILRNQAGEIVFARQVDPKLMRLVRLDDPILVEKEVERGGVKVTVPISLRERRYVEHVGGGALVPKFTQQGFLGAGVDPNATVSTLDTSRLFSTHGTRIIYFKEFGASRDLDMWTGTWAKDGEDEIPMERRATEIIHFGIRKSARTPYFLPRWINNLPSVIGSRKAEEFNLAFFNAGGVPPLLITVAGGQLAERSAKALDEKLNNRDAGMRHQAVVIEVASSGRIDKGSNKVQVNVERFGSEKMQDALFLKYDERTSSNIRQSFRLPPLFVGDPEAHNFATARASYLVAEAQVFQPERDEFDEIVTMKLLRNMRNGERFRFRSLPLVIDDAEQQIKCIELVAEQALVSPDQLVEAINKVCGLEFRFDQDANDQAREERMSRVTAMAEGFARTNTRGEGREENEDEGGSEESGEIQDDEGARTGSSKIEKMSGAALIDKLDGLVILGLDLVDAMEGGFENAVARKSMRKNTIFYESLLPVERKVVDRVMAMRGLGEDREDLMGLFGCSAAIIAANAETELNLE